MTLEKLLDIFPKKEFQHESDYKPLFDHLLELRKKEQFERKIYKSKDFDLLGKEGLTCDMVFACFLGKLASNCCQDDQAKTFLNEAVIIVSLMRKLLNDRGYLVSQLSSEEKNQTQEFCQLSQDKISIIIELLPEFLFELFPCYLSNILR